MSFASDMASTSDVTLPFGSTSATSKLEVERVGPIRDREGSKGVFTYIRYRFKRANFDFRYIEEDEINFG